MNKVLSEQDRALLGLMDRQYQEIRGIEADWQIMGQEGDFRPRIEYYHDAARALSSGMELFSKDSRLSVERLAYDVSMLRHIQAKPLTYGRSDQHFSPHAELQVSGGGRADSGMDRETRQRLGQLYKDYTVLFVAVFAEKAEKNADARTEEINTLVEDCHTLQDLMEKLARGEVSVAEVMSAAQHIENDQLRRNLLTMLSQKKPQAKDISNGLNSLKNAMSTMDKEIKAIDQAGMNFATAQLAVYEDAKDTVKRLVSSGLNVAGKFVENAMAQTSGKGRGR